MKHTTRSARVEPTLRPQLITQIETSERRVRAGQSFLVSVTTSEPGHAVTIQGSVGSKQYLQLSGLPGPRDILVTASRGRAFEQRSVRVWLVDEPSGATPLPLLSFAPDRYRPRVAHFSLAEAFDTPSSFTPLSLHTLASRSPWSSPRIYQWAFGDGMVADSLKPFIEYDYSDSLARDEVFSTFDVRVTILDGDRSVGSAVRTLSVSNPYAWNKQRGILRPPVDPVTTVGRTPHAYVCNFTVNNLEDEPIVFTELRIERRHYEDEDPRFVDVPGTPQGCEIVLPANAPSSHKVEIPVLGFTADMFGAAVYLRGASASGRLASASAYFEMRPAARPSRLVPSSRIVGALDEVRATTRSSSISHATLDTIARDTRAGSNVSVLLATPPTEGGSRKYPRGGSRGSELGDECDPTNYPDPPPEGMTCQLTSEKPRYVAVPGRLVNAKKGDLILSPGGQGFIGQLLRHVSPPQNYSHCGIMTRNYDQISHSTASQDWILAHPVGLMGEPTDGFEPAALRYAWPGAITQSIDNAYVGELMKSPEGTNYRIGSFAFDPVATDAWTLIYPMVVKPPPENETVAVRQKLHAVADAALAVVKNGSHYRFYAYTDPAKVAVEPAGDDAGWAKGTVGTCCSSFIWLAAKNAAFNLEGPEPNTSPTDLEATDTAQGAEADAATTQDGLYYYTADERQAAANWLFNFTAWTAYQKLVEIFGIFAADAELLTGAAVHVANQLCNAFALDWTDGSSKDSDDWRKTGAASAVSPDNMTFWDSPGPYNHGGFRGLYGAAEELFYAPGHYDSVPVSRWASTHGPGQVRGQVLFDGAAVEGATLEIAGQTRTSGAGGMFLFETIPDGSYSLTAGAVVAERWASDAEPVVVKTGATTEQIMNLGLPPEANREIEISAYIGILYSPTFGSDSDSNETLIKFIEVHPFLSHNSATFEHEESGIVGHVNVSLDLKLDSSVDVSCDVHLIDDDGDDEGQKSNSFNVPKDGGMKWEGINFHHTDPTGRKIEIWAGVTVINRLARA